MARHPLDDHFMRIGTDLFDGQCPQLVAGKRKTAFSVSGHCGSCSQDGKDPAAASPCPGFRHHPADRRDIRTASYDVGCMGGGFRRSPRLTGWLGPRVSSGGSLPCLVFELPQSDSIRFDEPPRLKGRAKRPENWGKPDPTGLGGNDRLLKASVWHHGCLSNTETKKWISKPQPL